MNTKKKSATGARTVPVSKGPAQTADGEPKSAAERQMTRWAQAVQLFSGRNYAEALPLFNEAAKGPASHIADKARSYAQILAPRNCVPSAS